MAIRHSLKEEGSNAREVCFHSCSSASAERLEIFAYQRRVCRSPLRLTAADISPKRQFQATDWAPPAMRHALQMRQYKDSDNGSDATPKIIPTLSKDKDPHGVVETYQSGAPTFTSSNAFFQSIGTNGRTCFTCHQPQNGWTVSAAGVQERFAASGGSDPIFRLVDGATCPTNNVKTIGDKRQAYKLVIEKGLIRIGLAMPPNPQFEVTKVDDPYGCTTNPATGLTSKTEGIVSVYRRPLPATNLGFLTTIMWDGREPSLASQAVHATQGHAQAVQPPTSGNKLRSLTSRLISLLHKPSTTMRVISARTVHTAVLPRCLSSLAIFLSESTIR